MKKNYLSIKTTLILAFTFLLQNLTAQCVVSNNPQFAAPWESTANWSIGQGFTAECSGALEYVQFLAASTGTISAGTLKVYSGNTVSGTPIYTQAYPEITISQVNDPIRINVTGNVNVSQSNQYTFEFTIDTGMSIVADFVNEYTGGNLFRDGVGLSITDAKFSVSISDDTLGVDAFNVSNNIKVLPNPASEYIKVSGLKNIATYSIYNALGSKITHGKISDNEAIDIKSFANGLYFLKLENGNTVKFIKY
ncbi:Por secretion system C-terminal sorting domain-containing protein [Bizionia echini]|uniref:Por secretion system C-terminal sorting domain-containing protein n=1 Tax=Bizionia echini TaxID=649333 RepID=A0A1I4ZEC3_9FLAO|nr:T9SS type A sorting domain-containing protein [Bizionia echini]SFN48547.1 Por secretion system C-terminal sorting domain-containing protein [Bizionia echini]